MAAITGRSESPDKMVVPSSCVWSLQVCMPQFWADISTRGTLVVKKRFNIGESADLMIESDANCIKND